MDLEIALAVLRVFAGLVIAAHGAQKALGLWGGPGLGGATHMVGSLSFRPAGLWGNVLAWGELVGGLLLAVGFLTGIAAAVVLVDMVVATWKVHWPKGFWNSKGGIEFTLTLAVIFALFGLVGAGAYSLDAALGLVGWTTLTFFAAALIGLAAVWAGTQPQAGAIGREVRERGRRAA